jgi:hypothetical protein
MSVMPSSARGSRWHRIGALAAPASVAVAHRAVRRSLPAVRRLVVVAVFTAAAGLLSLPTHSAGADTGKCKAVKLGGRYDISADVEGFANGAIGTEPLWEVRADDEVSYLSARLIGGDATRRVGKWARVKFSPSASGVLWAVNEVARIYSIYGVDISRSRVEELTDNGSEAAKKSRACARRRRP